MDLSDINWYRFSNYNNFWEMEKSAKKILIESKKYDIKDVYNYIKSNDISCDYKFLDNMAYLIEKKYDNKKKQIAFSKSNKMKKKLFVINLFVYVYIFFFCV